MIVENPLWLLLLPVLVPLILLFHARRRTNLVVASLALWRRVPVTASKAVSPKRIPWRDKSLWLQLATASALVIALAGPTLVRGSTTDHWVVLVDASTSMNATDIEPSRFAAAIESMFSRFGQVAATGNVSVVRVGATSEIVAAGWPLGPGLRTVEARLTPGEGTPDWTGAALRAIQLAGSLGEGSSRVIVYTDAYGIGPATDALTRAGFSPAAREMQVVGTSLVNVGVDDVEASLRGDGGNQWTVTGMLRASGFVPGDVVRVVAAYRFPGTEVFLPWGGEDVALSADLTGAFAIPLDLPGSGEVKISGPDGDQLPVDDAVVVNLSDDTRRVGIIGNAPAALLAALAAAQGIEVYAVDRTVAAADLSPFDLVIITETYGEVPPTSTWWFGSVPPSAVAGDVTEPLADRVRTGSHPLVADVEGEALALRRARSLHLLAGAEPLFRADETVLGWARTASTGRQVALGFALDDTDWASQLSFPLFVARLLAWVPRVHLGPDDRCIVGAVCALPRQVLSNGGEVLGPGGEVVAGLTGPEAVESDPLAAAVWLPSSMDADFIPQRSGFHSFETDTSVTPIFVAVNAVGRQPADMPEGGGSTAVGRRTNLWWVFALATIALIIGEAYLVTRSHVHVVKSRYRRPNVLGALAVLAVLAAVLGVPLPSATPTGTITWIDNAGREAPPRTALPTGWTSRYVSVEPVLHASSTTLPTDGTVGHKAESAAIAATQVLRSDETSMAIELALAAPASGGAQRVVVVATEPTMLSEVRLQDLIATADRSGAQVDVVTLEPSRADDMAALGQLSIDQVAMPPTIRAFSPYQVEVDVKAPEGFDWILTAELTSSRADPDDTDEGAQLFGASTTRLATSVLPAATPIVEVRGVGSGSARIELSTGEPGHLVYQLTLASADDSTQRVRVPLDVVVRDRLTALLVTSDDSYGDGIAAALSTQGVSVATVTPLRMPATAEALDRFDAVFVVNVPASEIFPEYQAELERYVREKGGGLVLFGGPDAFGPGGYYATPLEELSPLSSVVTDDAPEVAMAFVLDRSGSMSGAVGGSNRMDLAKAATLEAVSLLGENSQVAIVVFDTTARLVLPFTPVTEREAVVRALASVTPGGGTAIHPGLVAVRTLIETSPAATRHVVVMTDGLSQEGDFETVLGALNDLGVATSFVGVGSAADRRQLSTLAGYSGGALHLAQDFRALPSLLAQEALMLAADPIEERLTEGEWTAPGVPEFLEGVVEASVPPLLGYVRTTAKPEATVHLIETVEDDPLFATWRYGLGRVAAFASEADGPWSREWVAGPQYARMWSQVTRWVAESPIREPWTIRVAGSGDTLHVQIDVPTSPAVVTTNRTVLELWSDEHLLARRQVMLDGAGGASARFEIAADWSGELELRLASQPDEGLSLGLTRTLSWPVAPVSGVRIDDVSIEELARATGGHVTSAADYRLSEVGRSLTWTVFRTAWLLLAAALFIAALAVRYGVLSTLTHITLSRVARTRTT